MKTDKAIALLFVLAFGCEKGPPDLSKPADPAKTTNTAAPTSPTMPQMPEKPQIPAPPDVAAPPADAQKTSTGLASKVLQPGTGKDHPNASAKVKVHYTGWTTDGKMFDSSIKQGEPAMFQLDMVIPGWTEGVGLMTEGEKRRLWIPQDLAYKGQPGMPAGMLVFDVELLRIMKPEGAAPAASGSASAAASAKPAASAPAASASAKK